MSKGKATDKQIAAQLLGRFLVDSFFWREMEWAESVCEDQKLDGERLERIGYYMNKIVAPFERRLEKIKGAERVV